MRRRNASGKGPGLLAAAIIAFTAAGLCSLPVRAEISGQAFVPSDSSSPALPEIQGHQSQQATHSKHEADSLLSQVMPSGAAPQAVKLTAEAAQASLAAQPSFKGWKNANLTFSPLGPGTHAWLVLVQTAGESAGYMIISQGKDGSLQLNEYGTGSLPPFSLNVLKPVIESLAAAAQTTTKNIRVIPVYEEPALVYWTVQSPAWEQTLYIDAFTGQDLPLEEPGWRSKLEQAASSAGMASPLTDSALTDTYSSLADHNPYADLAWVQQKPLSLQSSSEFEEALQASPRMIYSAQGLNYVFNSPFTVGGYQQWSSGDSATDGILYVRTEYTGQMTRYLPFSRLAAAGAFYTLENEGH
ncbi:hypothetical protein OIN60_12955 [Paenibacillus sp. P96]|uniref:Uncharacterized protein n=1 Tax=Paenibacillus zeirhizosphaerae TaxID=2987519 RepID=A0ABT9FSH7_9BACL|nr:hypothetical protein [Paenibacillus sp. P96]MDP4097680.1 hypothetical protein [Paenibacillus sp. P96]